MKKAIKIIESEIEWHWQNQSEAPSVDAAIYFIKGMQYILDLFNEIRTMEEDD